MHAAQQHGPIAVAALLSDPATVPVGGDEYLLATLELTGVLVDMLGDDYTLPEDALAGVFGREWNYRPRNGLTVEAECLSLLDQAELDAEGVDAILLHSLARMPVVQAMVTTDQ